MPGPEVLDARLRRALQSVDQPAPPPGALSAARRTAKARVRRRRLLGAAALVAVAAPVAGLLAAGSGSGERVSTVVDEGRDDQDSVDRTLPVAPLSHAWLIDEPLPPTDLIDVIDDEHGVMSVSVSEEGYLGTRFTPAGDISSGGSLGDSEISPALGLMTGGPAGSEEDDLSGHFVASWIDGYTRAEVVRLELTTPNGTWSIPTVAHPALPQLRFFAITGEFGQLDAPHPLSPSTTSSLVGYGADGQRLLDWAEVMEHHHQFWPTTTVDRIPAELPADFRDQLVELATGELTTGPRSLMVPTWLPPGLVGVTAEVTEDGYRLRFESADRQRSVAIGHHGHRPGVAHVEIEGLPLTDRLRIKRGLAGLGSTDEGLPSLPPGPVAPAPQVAEPLQDGVHFAYLIDVDPDGATVTVDVAQWLSGAEADAAYQAETGDRDGAPNDYFILNPDEETRVLLVDDPNVTVAWDDQGPRQRGLAFTDLEAYLDQRQDTAGSFWITVSDGLVVALDEQYRP